jgi:polysaccharide biosynthesis protein PelF
VTDLDETSDVCLIVEGAYPYVVGGVANWIQDLIIGMPNIRFSIIAIKPSDIPFPWKMTPPPNVVSILEVPLTFRPSPPRRLPSRWLTRIGNLLLTFFEKGETRCLIRLTREISALKVRPSVGDILSNPQMFELLQQHYQKAFRSTSFHHYFWAMRALLGGLLAVLLTPFPKARVYHTISTGFAGLLAARIAYQSGRPAFVTEHGLYLLERQIEVMMADWIGDQIDSGLVLDRDDHDMRDLWINAFKSYTQACYNACDPIIALYKANNIAQQRLGAPAARVRVIPNGIDPSRFGTQKDERDLARPLVALIGRVVPIKDIKTFIRAAGLVCAKLPNARFVVLGPEDEDRDYALDCRALVKDLELEDVFSFAGRVDVGKWLPRIDLLVLTSLSEAQPLVILEGGICGIPTVAPDVGSCREMLEGTGGPLDKPGGIVTALVDPEDTARAITRLLKDPELRAEMGAALRDRVIRSYDRTSIIAQYRDLYETLAERGAPIARASRVSEMAGVSA